MHAKRHQRSNKDPLAIDVVFRISGRLLAAIETAAGACGESRNAFAVRLLQDTVTQRRLIGAGKASADLLLEDRIRVPFRMKRRLVAAVDRHAGRQGITRPALFYDAVLRELARLGLSVLDVGDPTGGPSGARICRVGERRKIGMRINTNLLALVEAAAAEHGLCRNEFAVDAVGNRLLDGRSFCRTGASVDLILGHRTQVLFWFDRVVLRHMDRAVARSGSTRSSWIVDALLRHLAELCPEAL